MPPPEQANVQDVGAGVWLEEHGYFEVPRGVTDATPEGWALYDGLTFSLFGLAGLGTAMLLVNRRRPLQVIAQAATRTGCPAP